MACYVMPPKRSTSKDSLLELFLKFDKDHSGTISAKELQLALTNGSWKPFDMKTVRMMMDMYDKDGSGTINFKEFSSLWKKITEWQNLFRTVDQNNSGAIDLYEFKNLLVEIGHPNVSDETLARLMRKYSHSGHTLLYLDAFIRCCISINNGFEPSAPSKPSSITSNICSACCFL